MAAIHPSPSDLGSQRMVHPQAEDSNCDASSKSQQQSPLVRVQAQMRGKLARNRWNKIRLAHQGSVAWRDTHAESRVWVVRPKLVLDLLQHDHFQKAGIFWLLLYILFIVVFVSAAVHGQRGNLYYEMEAGLEQRFGEAGGGIDSVHSVSQVWDWLNSFVTILHEDEDPARNQTRGHHLVREDDWSYWAQFKVDPPALESPAGSGERERRVPRQVALQNHVIGPGVLIAQRRWQLTPSCDRYAAPVDSSNSDACLSQSASTTGFPGKQSRARYKWVPQCDCFPAGIFGTTGTKTTLLHDQQRLHQLQNDGWLNEQTSELKVFMMLHNPTRAQLGLVTVQFAFLDSGWVTGEIFAESTPVWRPYHEMAVLTILTVLLWLVHVVAEIQYACKIGLKSYLNVYNTIGIVSLILMLYIFVITGLLQLSKRAVPDALQAAHRDAEVGVYNFEVFADVEDVMQQSRLVNMLLSIDTLLMMTQLFKYFRFSRRLSMLSNALAHAAPDMLHLFISFSQFVVGFACAGHLGFGRDNATFSTFSSTLNTLLLWTVGSLSEPPSVAQHDMAYFLFFWVFILIGHLIIINVLLSIFIDSWMHVKEESDQYRRVRNQLSGTASANRSQRRRMYSALGGFDSSSFKVDPTRTLHRCASKLGCWEYCVRLKHGFPCRLEYCCKRSDKNSTLKSPKKSSPTMSPTHSGLSPNTMKALRGFSFERLEVILLQSIQDAKKGSGNNQLYEHNVTLDRMDFSILLWPDVPRGLAYILFDAFKQPLDDGDMRGGDGSVQARKPSPDTRQNSLGSARRASLPACFEPTLSTRPHGRNGSAANAVSILRNGNGNRGANVDPDATQQQFQALERRLDGLECKLDAVLNELRATNDHARTRPNDHARTRPYPTIQVYNES